MSAITRAASRRNWVSSGDFAYGIPLIELDGLTMGLVGFGAIAQAVARVAQAFGMRAVAHRRSDRPRKCRGSSGSTWKRCFARAMVSVHCPLTPETRGPLNAERFATMKPSAYLLNTGRGPLVNEADLAQALDAGRIAGAGLDVLSEEPPKRTTRCWARRIV